MATAGVARQARFVAKAKPARKKGLLAGSSKTSAIRAFIQKTPRIQENRVNAQPANLCPRGILRTILVSVGLVSTTPVGAAGLFGEVGVVDGDTIEIAGEVVRLWGIDAPEKEQLCWRDKEPWACGQAAADALAQLIEGTKVSCVGLNVDSAGLVHALCRIGKTSINATVVSAGWALDDSRRSGGAYAYLQAEAKAAKRGLWVGEFDLPWKWRQHIAPALVKIELTSATRPPIPNDPTTPTWSMPHVSSSSAGRR